MNKAIILAALFLAMTACSSAEKSEEPTSATTEQTASQGDDAKAATDSKESEGTASKTSCTMDKDTRVIEVKKTEGGGCELFYVKFGESKSVASSGFGTQYCEEVKDRIEANLKKAGFTCQ